VDTASTRDWSSQQVSDAILGPPGTKVRVRFARPGVGQPIEHTLTRAVIHIPAVPYALMLDGRVGYIPLQSFNETASRELTDAIARLTKQGAKSLVVDLRNDPGGILDQALSIGDLFLRDGQEIASVRPRSGKEQQFVAQGREHIPEIPLVVMVNGYSASASEIVAGALQDHDRALVVGTTSYGKGLVQSVFPLDGGYALKLTTAKWYTPSGRSITKEHTTADRGVATLGAQRDSGGDEQLPDSLEKESVKKNRPAFRSDAGRVVYGGGGITPDVIVPEDTVSTAEQALARALAPKAAIVNAALYDMAIALKPTATPSLTVKPEWREDFYRRLTAAGVQIDRKLFDAGAPIVDRWIARQVVRQSFGDSTLTRASIPEDPQLQRAIELLRKGTTQKDLFALAQQYSQATVHRAP
jgi:carboxyl-terminal processing protease